MKDSMFKEHGVDLFYLGMRCGNGAVIPSEVCTLEQLYQAFKERMLSEINQERGEQNAENKEENTETNNEEH